MRLCVCVGGRGGGGLSSISFEKNYIYFIWCWNLYRKHRAYLHRCLNCVHLSLPPVHSIVCALVCFFLARCWCHLFMVNTHTIISEGWMKCSYDKSYILYTAANVEKKPYTHSVQLINFCFHFCALGAMYERYYNSNCHATNTPKILQLIKGQDYLLVLKKKPHLICGKVPMLWF